MHLKSTMYESTLSTADAVPLPRWGRLRYENTAFLDTTPFPREKAKRRRLRRPKKKANPASLRSAAPSKGRGSRGHSLLPMEGGAPKGRRLDGESGIFVSKPSPRGKAMIREHRYPHNVKTNTGNVEKNNTDGQSLPRMGKVASGASRIGYWRDERERGDRLKCVVCESTRAPPESQPRLAALGSPFQGKGLAWTLPPSYGRRCPEGAEVGWGYRYPRYTAFPSWGRWRAERAG